VRSCFHCLLQAWLLCVAFYVIVCCVVSVFGFNLCSLVARASSTSDIKGILRATLFLAFVLPAPLPTAGDAFRHNRLTICAAPLPGAHVESAGASKKSASKKKSKSKSKSNSKTKKTHNNRPKHNHSKIAIDIFKNWFIANMRRPFPSDEVKAEFAARTGLSHL